MRDIIGWLIVIIVLSPVWIAWWNGFMGAKEDEWRRKYEREQREKEVK